MTGQSIGLQLVGHKTSIETGQDVLGFEEFCVCHRLTLRNQRAHFSDTRQPFITVSEEARENDSETPQKCRDKSSVVRTRIHRPSHCNLTRGHNCALTLDRTGDAHVPVHLEKPSAISRSPIARFPSYLARPTSTGGPSGPRVSPRPVTVPSTDILIKIAEALDVTRDYLAFDRASFVDGTKNIQDRELLRRFEAVDALSEKDRNLAKEILDLLVLKNRFQELAKNSL